MNLAIPTQILTQQSQLFCDLLEKQCFYDAHEALELIWFERRFEKENPEVVLLRAFINAAVSFELIKRERKKAAQKPWGFFLKHAHLLENAPFEHQSNYLLMHEKILQTFTELS